MARWTGQCRGGVPGAMARAWGSSSVRAGTEAVRWCWGAPPVAVRLKPPLLPPYRRPSLTISRMSSVRSAKLTSGCAAAWGKVPSHATARAAAHRSGGTGTCAPHVTRPSGPERSALAAGMSKGGGRRRRSFGIPGAWCTMVCAPLPACLPKVAEPSPAAFGHAGGWRRSPATAPRTSTGRWPSRRTSCPSAPSSARRPSSSQTRASTSSPSCHRRVALLTHRVGVGVGAAPAPCTAPYTQQQVATCGICKDMACAMHAYATHIHCIHTAYTLHAHVHAHVYVHAHVHVHAHVRVHVHCRSCRMASARSCLPRAGRRSRGAASRPRARPT